MQITKAIIENYRSIKKIEINFKSLFGLIGANSAGKSNILRALNLVLGEKYPMPHSLSKKDFYNEDFSNNIQITIYFDEPFQSYSQDCQGVVFKTVYDPTNSSFGTELKAIQCITNNCQSYNLKGDCKKQFSVLFIPATRNFEYHLQSNAEWSFLGKIIKQFNELFPQEKINELISKFEEVKSILEIEPFKEFEKSFKEYFKEHVLPTENDININFRACDPKSYYKTIEIIPSEHGGMKNIDQMGEGMKNLIFISLLRAYAKSFPKSTIFIIEEPELYLHPQGRLDLFNIFKSLASSGSQIIYTTHSQEFLDLEFFDNIGVVKKICESEEHFTILTQIKNEEFLTKWRASTEAIETNLNSIRLFLKNISDAETNKGFFAKKIVLVEGNTEKWMLPIYAQKESMQLEKNNIEIIGVGGKNNLEKFYLIFKELGYSVYVIFDGDKSKQNSEIVNKKLMKILIGIEEDYPETRIDSNFTVFEEDIEMELKASIENYDDLKVESKNEYGLGSYQSKVITARYIANNSLVPEFIKNILKKIFDL